MIEKLEIIDERILLGKQFKVYGDFENPLFLAKDVAEWIDYGISNVSKMVSSVDEDEKLITRINNTSATFLTESGLYEVLMLSRKPIAKKFKKEVKRILKEIRINGGYIQTNENDTDETIMAKALIIAQKTIEKNNKRIKQLESENTEKQKVIEEKENIISEQKPKAEFYDKVTESKDVFDFKKVAKTINCKGLGRNNLMAILKKENILDYQNLPYQRYVTQGYFKVVEKNYTDFFGNERVSTKTVVFQKGIDFIVRLLKKLGYLGDDK